MARSGRDLDFGLGISNLGFSGYELITTNLKSEFRNPLRSNPQSAFRNPKFYLLSTLNT